MVAEAFEQIFKLEENTWAFYYTETINTNQVCQENMVKLAQHHRLAPGALPHDVLDEILNHTLSVARKMNMVYFVNYASDFFQVEVSHLYDPKTPQFTLILKIPLVSNTNLLELYEFLLLPIHFNSQQMSQ